MFLPAALARAQWVRVLVPDVVACEITMPSARAQKAKKDAHTFIALIALRVYKELSVLEQWVAYYGLRCWPPILRHLLRE